MSNKYLKLNSFQLRHSMPALKPIRGNLNTDSLCTEKPKMLFYFQSASTRITTDSSLSFHQTVKAIKKIIYLKGAFLHQTSAFQETKEPLKYNSL